MIKGKKGVIFGIANDHSIAWGIAEKLYNNGAELVITYQNATLLKRVKPLAEKVNCNSLIECDVSKEEDIKNALNTVQNKFGKIDFIIHAVAFSDKNELNGRYIETSKDNFINSLSVSCYSFTMIAKLFQPIINYNGSLVTLSFYGANKVMPNYNVMGVAKAALETSVKYLSVDLGDYNIRVNAISAGPMRTLAGAAIANARDVFKYSNENSSLKRNVKLEELGNSALYLVSNLSSAITGEIHYVDCGFNIIGMPKA
ncbi:enoyl-ACP reductase [Pelagibacterales bacterium SAG-MED31]|nr:enoyl-ACP reductase [Pelagibacterales bacterium SAG-MED31]